MTNRTTNHAIKNTTSAFSLENALPVIMAFIGWLIWYFGSIWIVDSNLEWFESAPGLMPDMILIALFGMRVVVAPTLGLLVGVWIAEYPERRESDERYCQVRRRIRARARRRRWTQVR